MYLPQGQEKPGHWWCVGLCSLQCELSMSLKGLDRKYTAGKLLALHMVEWGSISGTTYVEFTNAIPGVNFEHC